MKSTTWPTFGDTTTATEVADAFSDQIRGKNVLLVGVSPNSLGEHIALAISRHSPSLVILASRTASKINQVIDSIHASKPSCLVKSLTLDLSSQSSIRSAAKELNALTQKLDIIINNAALNVPDYETTQEGIEMHFGTNHIGLFLLTNLVLPSVLSAVSSSAVPGSTRIVNMTSAGHRLSPIRFSDYNFRKVASELPMEERPPEGLPKALTDPERPYSPFVAYGQSKTGNILFSVSLTEALGGRGVRSFSVHPGSIWTGLARNLDEQGQALIKATGKVWKTGDQGAATAVVAAFDPKLNDVLGGYLADCQLAPAAEFATDPKIAERLWDLSEELVGEKFDLGGK
ncbi:NAD(P)-binding protein [Hyaloscypha variabilis F]|uniref:NAD(P)-binding protein n=1 Tax=Hyaloscypha variabilis (strain UAMH 11265 / GT02V1 / F) TaxID=1149755 RepID=A0A2J6REY0_HYAVF|nr:NAD(P)-binding protein [Hyaloscypha variabilis F]